MSKRIKILNPSVEAMNVIEKILLNMDEDIFNLYLFGFS